MAQDIRKVAQEPEELQPSLPKGHEARFEARLQAAFATKEKEPKNPSVFGWIKIAAIAIVCLGGSLLGYVALTPPALNSPAIVETNPVVQKETPLAQKQYTLGDLSPGLKKIEDFYLTGINVQLASLDIKDENKELINGYMEQLTVLDSAYKELNAELNEVGPTEATITALIDNLKIRLELLFKLKNKLKELKNQENEQFTSLQS